MKQTLILDIQHTDPNRFPNQDRKVYLQEYKARNIPLHIALTPYQRDQWKDLEDDIGELILRSGSGLLLEGLIHTCMLRSHTIRDPHHENICTSWFQKPSSYQQQADNIGEGSDFLGKIFGINPIGFVPPQHLWNADTQRAVHNEGMKYLITNAMFPNMRPYREEGVIVVPSGSIKHGRTQNPVVHIYYDWIQRQQETVDQAIQDIVPLSDIPIGQKTIAHQLNSPYLSATKQIRDARRLINWLVNSETRSEPDAKTLGRERIAQYERHRREVFREE